MFSAPVPSRLHSDMTSADSNDCDWTESCNLCIHPENAILELLREQNLLIFGQYLKHKRTHTKNYADTDYNYSCPGGLDSITLDR